MAGALTGGVVRGRAARDKGGVRPVLQQILAYPLPTRCAGCGAIVPAEGRFCAECWGSLRFIGPPWCAACHAPFEHDRGEGARCEPCEARPPRHAGVRAAVAYGPIARALALKLKYGGRIGVAQTVAALMRRHLPADATLLVPVPLHRWRLWQRGYNQAALIAAALAGAGGPPLAHALCRTRQTPVLRGMNGAARARAVRGAFALAPGADVAGLHVVLVDDVHTSGATADACAAALLDGGAARVSVLCWARVLDGGD